MGDPGERGVRLGAGHQGLCFLAGGPQLLTSPRAPALLCKAVVGKVKEGGRQSCPPPPSPRRAVITCETLGETHGAPSAASVLDSSLFIAT